MEGFSPGIQALARFVQQAGVELDNTNVPMGAADVHGAALDAMGPTPLSWASPGPLRRMDQRGSNGCHQVGATH
jgi:hypothetical protein